MNYFVKKIQGHENANCKVRIYEDGTKEFVSYSTTVATVTPDNFLIVIGLYSMTTRKQLGWFMQEYCNSSYQAAKECYEKNIGVNLITGEIIEL